MSKITLIGFYNYDNTLFSQMALPAGIDKDLVINNILLRGGEFESLYADPDFIKQAISVWSNKWYRTFDKWQAALAVSYDPLFNYDRTEEYREDLTHSGSGVITDSGSRENRSSSDGTDHSSEENRASSDGTDHNENEQHSENTVSAYNSSSYEPDNKTDVTGENSSLTHSNSMATNESSKQTHENVLSSEEIANEQNRRDTSNDAKEYKLRAYGNIGVTTSQQMLQSELELQEWNLIEHITDIFLQEFTIPVYI